MDLCNEVETIAGKHNTIPPKLKELSQAYDDFVRALHSEHLELKAFPQHTTPCKKVVVTHTFVKPSSGYKNDAFISYGKNYDENITVDAAYEYIKDGLFFFTERTKMIDMDLFNQYLLPLIKQRIKDTHAYIMDGIANLLVHQAKIIEEAKNKRAKLNFIKLHSIVVLLLGVALLPLPYVYYTFLRISIFIIMSLLAYAAYREKSISFMIAPVIFAILYNPFIIVHFEKETWSVINIVTIFYLLLQMYRVWRRKPVLQPVKIDTDDEIPF